MRFENISETFGTQIKLDELVLKEYIAGEISVNR